MCNFAGTILGSLFTPWWIIVAPTGRCFLSWTSTVHSHRAAPEAHRPFPQPPVSPVHGLVASTTSAFFLFRKPFSPLPLPYAFAKVFPEVRTVCALDQVKTVPASLIARWKFHFGSLWPLESLEIATLWTVLLEPPLQHTGRSFLSSFVVWNHIIDEKKDLSARSSNWNPIYYSGRYIYI